MSSFEIFLRSSEDAAIVDVTSRLHVIGYLSRSMATRTDSVGRAHWTVADTWTRARLEVGPIPGHWSIGENCHVSGGNSRSYRASALIDAIDGFGWWHRCVGLTLNNELRGAGVKIGVIDTGCGPHPALAHVQALGTFVDQTFTAGVDDEQEHGSHVCGIISARPSTAREFVGLAPDAELLVARVSRRGRYANQADIADALEALVERGVHLVNLSIGAAVPSPVLTDSIEAAWLHGVVCFAAAGNSAGDVLWPAKHELVVAVSALGRASEVPPGTLARLFLDDSELVDAASDFVFPDFCSRGPAVNCCAPGVGIISTLASQKTSSGQWGDMSGSSMAAPLALGVLAIILPDTEYLDMAADENRAKLVVDILREHCFPLSLPEDCQGNGLPMLNLGW